MIDLALFVLLLWALYYFLGLAYLILGVGMIVVWVLSGQAARDYRGSR